MTLRSDRRPAGSATAGFTLIELLAVLTLAGLVGALAVGSGRPASPSLQARALARDLADALRVARSAAITQNRQTAVTIDLTARAFAGGTGDARAFPGNLRVVMLVDKRTTNGGSGRILFDPDGSSSGGRVTIDGGGKVIQVGVDWLSGRTSIVEPPRADVP